MIKTSAIIRIAVTAALTMMSATAKSQVFVPPSGYSGALGPDVAVPPELGAPALTPVPAVSLSDRFNVDSSYRRAASASVKIIGAYTIADRNGAHFIDAWSAGYLPVTLRFSDDRCFVLSADYNGPRLSNARIVAAANCDRPSAYDWKRPTAPPESPLKFIGTSWGFTAWSDPKSGNTVVSSPQGTAFEQLYSIRMPVTAMMAMNSPDSPTGNITVVGRVDGRLTVVTLQVSY